MDFSRINMQYPRSVIAIHFKMSFLAVIFLLFCPVQSIVIEYTIFEEIPNGTWVGEIVVDADLMVKYDIKILRELTFRFLKEDDQNHLRFLIDEYTGEIFTNDTIDRDTLCSNSDECVLQHEVAVLNPSGHFEVITVKFNIMDINDNSPTFPNPEFSVLIPETATPGATYNLPLAVDNDSSVFSVQGYNLMTDTDNFELKVTFLKGVPKTIQLILRESVDREIKDSYKITLEAYDGGTPPKKGKLLIDVKVDDANDHEPVFKQSLYEVNIPENVPIYYSILQVEALDQDTGKNGAVSYKFASTTDDEFTRMFGIETKTGLIFLKQRLDFEWLENYHLMVEARDGGPNSQPAYATVVIHVEDVNDNPPEILLITLGGGNEAEISELAQPNMFIAHVSVYDLDGGSGGLFTCSLNDSHFRLVSLEEGHYEVHTAQRLDREIQETYEVTISCQDKGNISLSSHQKVTIILLDENDNAPEWNQKSYTVVLEENSRINALILRVNATDRDTGWNADITYSLSDKDKELFKVDPRTGIVRANAVFDYETTKEVQFEVIATDGAEPFLSSTVKVTVIILDANDEPPKFDKDVNIFDVMENQPIGFEVGQVIARDADSEPNNRVEYSLVHVSKDAEYFIIDTHTGSVRTNTELDRETRSSYYLNVMATNVGVAPPLSGSTIIEVKVRDENDNAPVIDFPNQNNNSIIISNQVPVGYQVGVIQAHDADLGVNSELTFVISSHTNNGMFAIDAKTGVIVTRSSLTHYDMETLKLDVNVADRGFPPNIVTAKLTFSINSSIPFTDLNPDSLLDGTNVNIVIGLSVASGVIMIILIIAIVCMRKRDCLRKQRMLHYQCRVEAQSDNSTDSEKGIGNMFNLSDENASKKRHTNIENSNNGSATRDYNLIMEGNGEGNLANLHSNSQHYNHHHMEGESRQQSSWLAQETTNKPNRGRGLQQNGNSSQMPLELKVHQLNAKNKSEEHDSDSAYSGDVSNTDSGRGASEEGETQGNASPVIYQPPANTRSANTVGEMQPDSVMKTSPSIYHITSFLPQVHPSSRKADSLTSQYDKNYLDMHDTKPKSIKLMVANNNHNCASRQPLPVPARQIWPVSQCQTSNSQCSSNKLGRRQQTNTDYSDKHSYLKNRSRQPSAQSSKQSPRPTSWDTIPEDDGGSTTSGSYIVDGDDLYFDDDDLQLASSVTV